MIIVNGLSLDLQPLVSALKLYYDFLKFSLSFRCNVSPKLGGCIRIKFSCLLGVLFQSK